jgi:hypothetical protein
MSSLMIIDGRIEALGQHIVQKRFIRYSYIRFSTNSGQTIMLNDVDLVNIIDSFLAPGVAGRFCYFDPGKGIPGLLERYKTICGIKINGKIVNGYAELESELNKARSLGILFTLIGLPSSCLLIGIPILIVGIMLITAKVPSFQDIQSALER